MAIFSIAIRKRRKKKDEVLIDYISSSINPSFECHNDKHGEKNEKKI